MKLSSTRQAIHDALSWGWQQGESSMVQYLTYLTRIEKSIRRGEPCGDFLEAAYICASINVLPIHVGGWLKFSYGPDDLPVVQHALASKLRFDLFPLASPKKHARYLSLSMTSLEDYRLGVWREKLIPIQLYAERMGTDPDNFSRDWGGKHKQVLKVIRYWDKEGVGQVSRMVRSLRGPTDAEDRPSSLLAEMKNPLQNEGREVYD